jgi:hypothetical protein
MKSKEARRVRGWLESFADNAADSAAFAVGPGVELLYGRPADGAFESDRGLVQYALTFANGDADRSAMQAYLNAGGKKVMNEAGWALNPAYVVLTSEVGQRRIQSSAALKTLEASVVAQRRAWLQELLALVRDGDPKAASVYQADAREYLKRMWTVTRVRASSSLQPLLIIEDTPSLRTYVTLLLLGPLGKDLRQCRLDGCARYFLVKKPPTGRPQELYCCRDHMLAAHGKNSTARSKRARAEQRTAIQAPARRPK